jgi:hypothetical protein
MGSFGIWHWIVVLFVLVIPVVMVVAIVWFTLRIAQNAPPPPVPPSPPVPTAESRMEELIALKLKGLITQAEFDQQRAKIISGV